MPLTIWTTPSEVPDSTPFENDDKHGAYDPKYVHQFWRILVETSRVFTDFRSRFTGKVSPVHFFWGGFDADPFFRTPGTCSPGGPNIPQFVQAEAYSHEVSSCGFWSCGGLVNEPVFYAYAYPEPQGFKGLPDPAVGSILPYTDGRIPTTLRCGSYCRVT